MRLPNMILGAPRGLNISFTTIQIVAISIIDHRAKYWRYSPVFLPVIHFKEALS